jgi:oligoendopeptidase F
MEITKPTRKFIKNGLEIKSWSDIEGYFSDLLERSIQTKEEFMQFLDDVSELEAVLEEDLAWRYIKMTIDTRDEALSEKYRVFVTEIQPKLAPYDDKLNKKIIDSPFISELENESSYFIMFRKIRRALELFREENIPLQAEMAEEAQKFGALSANQSIEHDGERLTMQKASLLLKEQDEVLREQIFNKIARCRREDFDKFNELFDKLLAIRHTIAKNAGYKNYRDYKLDSMGRFDYGVEDCKNFHRSVKEHIVPIVKVIQSKRLSKLGKDKFKPWDLDVDPEGNEPLKPFNTGAELLEGTVNMFAEIDEYFGDCLDTMNQMSHLDLESKDGKAPGGYNYPLYEIGVPFIFMNAVGSQRDLVTMVHEGGHAVHSFLSRDLPLTGFKNLPSEVAELASMAMELLSMDQWNTFYSDMEDLNRAKKEQLEGLIRILPWIAQVDEFQHWLYECHEHTKEDRTAKWMKLNKEYGTGLTDWTGFEDILETSWQRQLHIFEVPFYYIEYGIAQLGAIGIWKNSLENKDEAISKYKAALRLAYTKAIPEIYDTAGIQFDFSAEYIKELADFVNAELVKLN